MLLSEIVAVLGIPLPTGTPDNEITGIQDPDVAGENDIVFLTGPKYRDAVESGKARYVIVQRGERLKNRVCLEVDDPYVGYARVAQLFEDRTPVFGEGISSATVIDPAATIHETVSVGPGTVIGPDVTIGEQCQIGARCVIEKGCAIGNNCRIDSGVIIRYNCRIGNRTIIQSGAVIGSDGFGNARENGVFIRIPAFGTVVIGDDVNIGANTTVDRGNFTPTVIGNGVKLDNLIQIAHNVSIGDHSAMAAQTGISGSTRIGARAIIGGQAGTVGHIDIGDDTFIGAKAGVSKSVGPGKKVTGYPARDFMTMRRIEAAQLSLPEMQKELKRLKKKVDALTRFLETSSQDEDTR